MKKNRQPILPPMLYREKTHHSAQKIPFLLLSFLFMMSFSFLNAQTECAPTDGKIWKVERSNIFWNQPSENTYTEGNAIRANGSNNTLSYGDIGIGPDGKLYGIAYGVPPSGYTKGAIYEIPATVLNDVAYSGTNTLRVSTTFSSNDFRANSLYVDNYYNFYYAAPTASAPVETAQKIFWKGPSTNSTQTVWADLNTLNSTIKSALNITGNNTSSETNGTFPGDITILNNKLYVLWLTSSNLRSGKLYLLEFGINQSTGAWDGTFNYYFIKNAPGNQDAEPHGLTTLNGELYMAYSQYTRNTNRVGNLFRINFPLPATGLQISYTELSKSLYNEYASGLSSKHESLLNLAYPPKVSANNAVIDCSVGAYNLTTLANTSVLARGMSYVWYKREGTTDTQVTDPTAVGAGTYVMRVKGFKRTVTWNGTTPTYSDTDCYSVASTPVVITAENCITCTAPPYTGGPTNP
ncbi:MAG: hypothetical protein Q4G27_10330, partial [Flavobacteriaceae bacterium]|nr:hypothetical protein [Flavobacteriaceae bacterium]